MKILLKILIIVIVTSSIYLPDNYPVSSKSALQLNSYSIKNEQNNDTNYFFKAICSPLQVALPENQLTSTISIYQQVFKIFSFNSSLITQKNKNALFYITPEYVSLYKFICNKLKKSDLIFPFHFFL